MKESNPDDEVLEPPTEPAANEFIGRDPDTITVIGDIVGPTAPDWEVGTDL